VSFASANDRSVKKSYHRKALELHPDRNYGNVEDSTSQFAEVQSAYEVLSDAQERAWYDSHRDQILSGGEPDVEAPYQNHTKMTTSEDIFKLYSRFSGVMDYSKAPTGFYAQLCALFGQLADEEYASSGAIDEYPTFGTAEDDYVTVVRPFYLYWGGFSTGKSFAWKDIHRCSEAPDRRVRRLMERGNKHARDEAIRDFNETVRTLVTFARKRDPRYKAHAQNDTERQDALREQSNIQATKARAANQAKLEKYDVPDWSNFREGEDQEDGVVWDDEIEDVREQYECVVCDKIFRSEQQYSAHERSKKHLQESKKLKREMQKDNVFFGLGEDREEDTGRNRNDAMATQNWST